MKIHSKTHQIASFKKIFSWEHAPEPSPCAACRFAACKFPNLKKKNSWPPPPPKSWGRPWMVSPHEFFKNSCSPIFMLFAICYYLR